MSELGDFLEARGEYVSLALVAVVLALASSPLAALTGLRRQAVTGLLLDAGIAFVVAGRVAYLLGEQPGDLLDPFVLIQFQSGIEPLAGALAAAVVTAWRARSAPVAALGSWFAVAALALALSVATYDLACVARDACYGAPAPPPLGFRMSGLADTRLATPLLEAALLLAVLGAIVTVWPRLPAYVHALLVAGAIASLRAGFTPLSVRQGDAVGVETYLLVALAAVALVAAIVAVLHARVRARAPAGGGSRG